MRLGVLALKISAAFHYLEFDPPLAPDAPIKGMLDLLHIGDQVGERDERGRGVTPGDDEVQRRWCGSSVVQGLLVDVGLTLPAIDVGLSGRRAIARQDLDQAVAVQVLYPHAVLAKGVLPVKMPTLRR